MILRSCAALVLLTSAASAGELMLASTYSDKWVATGHRMVPQDQTAAHKTLPFGTKLMVSYHRRKIVVTVNDRGPFVKGRSLDLSPSSARMLRFSGLARVRVDSWPPLPRLDPRR